MENPYAHHNCDRLIADGERIDSLRREKDIEFTRIMAK
jgi:hypothetical protein